MAVPRTRTREEEDTVITEDMVIVEDTEEEVSISTTIMEGTSSTEEDTLVVTVVGVTKADLIEEAVTTEVTKDIILTE